MALSYLNVAVTVRQYQDPETGAAKLNLAIIHFIIYTMCLSYCGVSECPRWKWSIEIVLQFLIS